MTCFYTYIVMSGFNRAEQIRAPPKLFRPNSGFLIQAVYIKNEGKNPLKSPLLKAPLS